MTVLEGLLPTLIFAGVSALTLPWMNPDRTGTRRFFLALFCALQLIYFTWRFDRTLPTSDSVIVALYQYTFLFLELVMAATAIDFYRSVAQTKERSSEADLHDQWYRSLPEPPLIDILIPTYNESWPILEKTLVGALAQNYPRFRVWILDDGRRPWLADATRKMGVGYVTRNDNAHAKAGNMNAGLAHIATLEKKPDFFAVLDADFIPRPQFLRRSMALMHDPKVGLVQTPQYHMNLDPFQVSFGEKGLPDCQRFTYDALLPSLDAEGGAFCCGSSFLIRARPLHEIGGFPTESITEDVLTTVKLARNGYRTVFLKEVLTTGLAPEGLHEFLTQRGRWSLGSMQIARWRWRFSDSLWKRIKTTEAAARWGYTSFVRLMFLLIPAVHWAFDVPPFEGAGLGEILFFTFPLLIMREIYRAWFSRGTLLPLVTEAAVLLPTLAVMRGTLKGLFQSKNHKFVVTDKGGQHAGIVIHWKTLRWFVAYALFIVGGIGYRVSYGDMLNDPGFATLTLFWNLMSLAIVVLAAYPCIQRPRRRAEERYVADSSVSLFVDGRRYPATMRDLSVGGVRVACDAAEVPLAVGDRVQLHFADLPVLNASVVRRGRAADWGLCFEVDDGLRRRLIQHIFCTDTYVHPIVQGSLRAVGRALFTVVAR